MKVIFLDVDDVLNSSRTAYAFGEYNHPKTVKNGAGKDLFDWVAIKMLQRFQSEHGVKFVLSSTWRKEIGYKQLGEVIGLDIIDRTPIDHDGRMRGNEIKAWLDAQPEGSIENWAIIDDDNDIRGEQLSSFVHVPRHNGLTFGNMSLLANILRVDLIKQ